MLAAPAWSAPRTVTLSLPTMDCLVCPNHVKKALGKVDGVSRVEVDFGRRQAIVRFDHARDQGCGLSVDGGRWRLVSAVDLASTLTCPQCGHAEAERALSRPSRGCLQQTSRR
jgi:mercuric transport protein